MNKGGIIALLLCTTLVATGCEGFGQAVTAHRDVVARAANHELKVEQVADWLSENPRLPAEPQVVEAVANLWVDYILLATEAAKDPTLGSVELDLLLRPQLEQEIVWKLRDRVIPPAEPLSDEELQRRYDEEQPGLQVRARHILVRVPPDATPAQRDSALSRIRTLRMRIQGGEDFGTLAQQFSDDTGSAQAGGDLGLFERGMMVPPFEEAAFALGVGEVSDVVETPFGYHLIKVEERVISAFEEIKEQYRMYLMQTAQTDAEEAYIRQLTEPLRITVQADAYDVVRELAQKPHIQLSGRAASRALVTYEGGAYNASEFLDVIRRSPPGQRSQISLAGDDQIQNVLFGLTQNKILVDEAKRQGMELTPEERESLVESTRRQVEAAAVQAGLTSIEPQPGENREQAIERHVAELMRSIIRGDANVFPLGPVTFSLREDYGATVFDRSFPTVVAQVESTRSRMEPAAMPPAGVPAAPMPMPSADPASPDAGAGAP